MLIPVHLGLEKPKTVLSAEQGNKLKVSEVGKKTLLEKSDLMISNKNLNSLKCLKAVP